MLKTLSKIIFGKKENKPESEEDIKASQKLARDSADPLESKVRGSGQFWPQTPAEIKLRDVSDFEVYVGREPIRYAADGASTESLGNAIVRKATDSAGSSQLKANLGIDGMFSLPAQLQNWYLSQSFIGYQACALIAQHWLVDKACSQSGEDAVRHGWEFKADGGDTLDDDQLNEIRDMDIKMNIMENLREANRFNNIFGIRVVIFEVESDDPLYYEKPFNIDGVTDGSYKGISQVDPYWMTPQMTSESTRDPSSMHFYDPEFWIISGKRYHRSHLVILRGPQPADILKPTYIFGGIPLTQRIYERVYAAERTANEAPLLALNKRTTAIHVDMTKAIANEQKLLEKIAMWVKYRDNHAVKILGLEESMDQFDTSLADFDAVIMNQYQLVAAIAKTPATKLLGTSPKGFNATGEFEMVSYHEELESVQARLQPILDRHYELMVKSMGMSLGINISWNEVDSISSAARAEMNNKKADTANKLITAGVISPDEDRRRLRDERDSGYNRLDDDDANTQPGASPENIAAYEKSGAEQEKAGAAQTTAGAREVAAGAQAHKVGSPDSQIGKVPTSPNDAKDSEPDLVSVLGKLLERITALEDHLIPEGREISSDASGRSTKPSTKPSVSPSVRGIKDVVGKMPKSKLPKTKIGGMIIHIENPRNSIRKGEGLDGPWQNTMAHHYGFISGTIGADGDEIDCFVGPSTKSKKAFVINQNDSSSGEFDEHKVMLGFDDAESAKAGYSACFGPDWSGFDSMFECDMDQLKEWMSGECNSPFDARCIASAGSAKSTY